MFETKLESLIGQQLKPGYCSKDSLGTEAQGCRISKGCAVLVWSLSCEFAKVWGRGNNCGHLQLDSPEQGPSALEMGLLTAWRSIESWYRRGVSKCWLSNVLGKGCYLKKLSSARAEQDSSLESCWWGVGCSAVRGPKAFKEVTSVRGVLWRSPATAADSRN